MKEKVLEIAKYAYEHVPFYKEKAIENQIEFTDKFQFTNLPIITKREIVGQPQNLLSDEVNINDLVTEHTSGTTGYELILYFSRLDSLERAMILWHEREKNLPNIMQKRKAMFNDSAWLGDSIVKQVDDMIYLNTKYLNDERFQQYYETIVEFQPEFIHVPCSVIYEFMRYLKRNSKKMPYQISYIELAGEYVSTGVYNDLKEFFEGALIINYYGSVEFYSIGHGCKNNVIHEVEDSVYIEILNQDEEGFGDIVVTSLVNKAMPLIRYQLGDIGRLHENTCTCGKTGRIIELRSGRSYDYYIDGDRKITGDYFRKVLVDYFKEIDDLSNIVQFSIIQKSKSILMYNLLLHNKIDTEEIKEYLMKRLNAFLNVPVEIEVETELDMTNKMKRKFKIYEFLK